MQPGNCAHWMNRALELAVRGRCGASPNPMVGAVVVDAESRLAGEGYHATFGGPHAEIVALEAAAHGLPVLAADLEGIQDAVVPGRTGHLLQPGDADLWARRVLDLLNHPSHLHELSRVARATVEECLTWTHMVDAYESLFQELLEDPC